MSEWDVGEIARIGELQRELNERMAQMTPEERAKVARVSLHHIALVDETAPRWYLLDDETEAA